MLKTAASHLFSSTKLHFRHLCTMFLCDYVNIRVVDGKGMGWMFLVKSGRNQNTWEVVRIVWKVREARSLCHIKQRWLTNPNIHTLKVTKWTNLISLTTFLKCRNVTISLNYTIKSDLYIFKNFVFQISDFGKNY